MIIAVVVVALCVGGAVTNHVGFVLGILIVGAISYFFGMVVALLLSAGFAVAGLISLSNHDFSAAEQVLETVGYLLIIWLGYRHKQQKQQQVEHRQNQGGAAPSHSPQTIPWSVNNEVRTSLAAVRFLLFPLNRDEETDRTIQRASAELSRIEDMFNEMEREKLTGQETTNEQERKRHIR